MTNDLTKTNPSPATLAVADPELQKLFEGRASEGLEDMKQADRATPFLGIVQSLSPQRDRNSEKFIVGAEEGDIFNTITSELYKFDKGVIVVPVAFQKVWNRWVPRDQGGGFLGSYSDPELSVPVFVPQRGAEYDGPAQTVETANHFVLARGDDGAWAPAILSMTSTKLAASRKWNTLITTAAAKYKAPTFARMYTLTTAQQKNEKGTFYNYRVADAGFVSAELFELASGFRAAIKAGLVGLDYSKSDKAVEGDEIPTEPTSGAKF